MSNGFQLIALIAELRSTFCLNQDDDFMLSLTKRLWW